MAGSVKSYFEEIFTWHRYEQSRDPVDLASMPIDSNCGRDCRKAIDSAKDLIQHTADAFGDGKLDHPKGHEIRQNISQAVMQICGCYICG